LLIIWPEHCSYNSKMPRSLVASSPFAWTKISQSLAKRR
jgi:hypothetical protein